MEEKFYTNVKDGKKLLVQIDEKFYRPAEVELLLGDSSLARQNLGWEPQANFYDLIKKMVNHDYKDIIKESRRK